MERVLLQKKKFVGQYVALRSASDKKVVAKGSDPLTVRKLAAKEGVDEPLIFFVSEPEDMITRCY